ncbi:MAG: lipid II flippase MurJ, partial [Pyrinomonadaceae bacterium]
MTIKLTRIQLIGMIFTSAVSVLWSIYHARQKFVWTELSALIANASALLFLALALGRFGIAAAAWAMVLRMGLQLAWLLPGLGWRPRGRARGQGVFKSPTMISAWQRLRPLLLGTAYYKTDPLVDRFLTSMSPAGDLSLLYMGQQLYGVVNVIVDKALSAPMVPLLAMQAQINDWQL